MQDILLDAFFDTIRMLPFLIFTYIGIELLEYKYGKTIRDKVKNAGKAGPAAGALFGCIPQCGFSVLATALYSKKLTSTGTLLAVYLSTSDEAIPVILAQPEKAHVILPLLLTKIALAVIAGYSIDFFLKKSPAPIAEGEICASREEISAEWPHPEDEKGCCGHHCASEKINIKELVLHPLIHTLKVLLFVFIITLILNYIIMQVGEENLGAILYKSSIIQPVLAGLIGLIPNCAASVAITQVFLQGGISFGAAIAGLSSSAGLGLIVLFRENKNVKDNIKVLGLLYSISVTAGILIQLLYG